MTQAFWQKDRKPHQAVAFMRRLVSALLRLVLSTQGGAG
jgi:hypothetical protein